jgi:hypothetical protein
LQIDRKEGMRAVETPIAPVYLPEPAAGCDVFGHGGTG